MISRSRLARRKAPREHTTLKGSLRIRRDQQETPHALQEAETTLLASNRRGSLGFAGLASHSGRSSVPFRRACSGTEDPSNCAQHYPRCATAWVEIPLTKQEV